MIFMDFLHKSLITKILSMVLLYILYIKLYIGSSHFCRYGPNMFHIGCSSLVAFTK